LTGPSRGCRYFCEFAQSPFSLRAFFPVCYIIYSSECCSFFLESSPVESSSRPTRKFPFFLVSSQHSPCCCARTTGRSTLDLWSLARSFPPFSFHCKVTPLSPFSFFDRSLFPAVSCVFASMPLQGLHPFPLFSLRSLDILPAPTLDAPPRVLIPSPFNWISSAVLTGEERQALTAPKNVSICSVVDSHAFTPPPEFSRSLC